VFIAASTLVVIVLYRREFHSDALCALRDGKVFNEAKPVAQKATAKLNN